MIMICPTSRAGTPQDVQTPIAELPVTAIYISYAQTVTSQIPWNPTVITSAATAPQVSFITNTGVGVPVMPVTGGGLAPPQPQVTNVGLVPVDVTTGAAGGWGVTVGLCAWVAGWGRGWDGDEGGVATTSILAFMGGAGGKFDALGLSGVGVAVLVVWVELARYHISHGLIRGSDEWVEPTIWVVP
ncbi:hypothetical protein GJ744_010668 [Endocarpon pusillum]|uniref:Uncharacterized protein n=1 Tax=Endocarpon pusillum TaxID=364733 RepID=A0A8H7AHV4_9EURO|nr:hypothetical protein GJ744_010668 [Endocarpon pusillum]